MDDLCLVTGGAGFIGCAVSTHLAEAFGSVVALDNLHPQVHTGGARPPALDPRVELVVGDVTHEQVWDDVLAGRRPRVVLHLAAETGTAQSLTESTRHATTNVVGTTRMLDALARHDALPDRVVLASSRAVYGEGAWRGDDGGVHQPGQRSHAMLAAAQWDFPGLTPLPAGDPLMLPAPTSVYGATKLAQEHVLRAWALAVGVEPVVLRLQNVYGPGQSLTNPYTGIVPLFARLARAGKSIPVYEDGAILRDFVHVDDVARALVMAVTGAAVPSDAVDVGSGAATSVLELAQRVAAVYAAPPPRVTGAFRDGDVRACWADPAPAHREIGWSPSVTLEEGLPQLCAWIDAQDPSAPDS
ncbi:MAG: NAD-dependent epimerase/dehydratase family protein [Actinomycetota bacterium]|nr:NAD-dependent epimerase/dehydratase family protein [Actinomycetota bacterium]